MKNDIIPLFREEFGFKEWEYWVEPYVDEEGIPEYPANLCVAPKNSMQDQMFRYEFGWWYNTDPLGWSLNALNDSLKKLGYNCKFHLFDLDGPFFLTMLKPQSSNLNALLE